MSWNSSTNIGYYYEPMLTTPTPTSFGTLLGGYAVSTLPPTTLTFMNTYLYAIRVTTSP
jgi:hypothetical protein